MAPDTYVYQLPDGRLISLAADLCKGASTVTYELKAVPPALRGQIVEAAIVIEASDPEHLFVPVPNLTGCARCGFARGHHPTLAMLRRDAAKGWR